MHIISRQGILVDPKKVNATMDWTLPKNTHEVHSFMGLANYYWNFMEWLANAMKTITTLECKGFRYECGIAFI